MMDPDLHPNVEPLSQERAVMRRKQKFQTKQHGEPQGESQGNREMVCMYDCDDYYLFPDVSNIAAINFV